MHKFDTAVIWVKVFPLSSHLLTCSNKVIIAFGSSWLNTIQLRLEVWMQIPGLAWSLCQQTSGWQQEFDPLLSPAFFLHSFRNVGGSSLTSFCMLIHVPARVQRPWARHLLGLLPFEKLGQRLSAEVMRKHPVELSFRRRESQNYTFNKANFRVKVISHTLVSTVSSFRSSRHGLVAPGMPQPDRNTVGGESS